MPRVSQILIVVMLLIGIVIGHYVGYEMGYNKGKEVIGAAATFTTIVTVMQTPSQEVSISSQTVAIVPLLDKNYFTTLMNWLDRANVSIHVIMYVVKYDPKDPNDPVDQILSKLVDAYKRGVDVRIVVDDETRDSCPETLEFLQSQGIPVKLDESSGRTTHTKLVIIDDKVVFVGSHNWTESALKYNHEASMLIISSDIAEQFEEYFESIWSKGRSI